MERKRKSVSSKWNRIWKANKGRTENTYLRDKECMLKQRIKLEM
jgi:hypothetical protein